VLHPYNKIEKGILNLLRRPATTEPAQQLIGGVTGKIVLVSSEASLKSRLA
jgi:hypothetical protein